MASAAEPGPELHPLRQTERPAFDEGTAAPIRVVDLFAGCGGLTLGLAQAALAAGRPVEIPLAVDFEPLAVDVYKQNFPFAKRVEAAPVESFFDGEVGSTETVAEHAIRSGVGDVTVLTGGPPCQGHSNLNNYTRRTDAKNALYLRMVRAAEVLAPQAVIIENVPAILRDRHAGESVVVQAERALAKLGYIVAHAVVSLAPIGVAQTRRRHVMLALRDRDSDPGRLISALAEGEGERDLDWAIRDLVGVDDGTLRDRAPQAKPDNLARMQWMLDEGEYDLPNERRPKCHQSEHSYKSMYGRLRWDEPAQTITSGFGSIGQGRFMHPDLARALTAHEAARIQGFPDYFDFSSCPTKSALATMIGNAVPPPLGAELLRSAIEAGAIPESRAAPRRTA